MSAPSGRSDASELEIAQRAARLSAVGLAAQLAGGIAALVAGLAAHSFVATGAATHVLAGAGAWAAGLLLASRRQRALDVVAQADGLAAARARAGHERLFAPEVEEEARALERFERRARPLLGVGWAALEVAAAVLLVSWARGRAPLAGPAPLLPSAAALGAIAFVALLLGRYSLAIARGTPDAPWTGGARRAASGALAALAGALALALGHAAPSLELDRLGWLFVVLELLLGVEAVLALVLEAYRPRRKGEAPHLAFESRLLGLLAEPGDVARSLARAVDYQFGFELSSTWSYRVVTRALPPLVAFAAAAFWLLSTLVIVPAHGRAIVERLGARRGEPLVPGLHWKLPAPLEAAETFDVERVREVVAGGDDDDHEAHTRFRTVLWTQAHGHRGDEPLLIVARKQEGPRDAREAPVSLIAARVPVRFRISDVRAFASAAAEPERLLEKLAERELTYVACGIDMQAVLGRGRTDLARELRERIGAAARSKRLGIDVLDVGLADLHPPVAVARAWEATTAALEGRETRRLAAVKAAAAIVPAARAEAFATSARALARAEARADLARTEAERFAALRALEKTAPRAFRNERLLAALEAATNSARKVLVGDDSVLDLDLTEKLGATQLDQGDGSEPEKKKE